MMNLQINGEKRQIPLSLTVTDLLKTLDIDSRRVAVEINRVIIKKREYDNHNLNDGDAVEIVNFVGGG